MAKADAKTEASTSNNVSSQPVSRRLRLIYFFMPWLGAILLLPPFVTIPGTQFLFGIPLILIYVFGVWLGLILLSLIANKRLETREIAPEPDGENP